MTQIFISRGDIYSSLASQRIQHSKPIIAIDVEPVGAVRVGSPLTKQCIQVSYANKPVSDRCDVTADR